MQVCFHLCGSLQRIPCCFWWKDTRALWLRPSFQSQLVPAKRCHLATKLHSEYTTLAKGPLRHNAPQCSTMLHNSPQTMLHNAPQCTTMLHNGAVRKPFLVRNWKRPLGTKPLPSWVGTNVLRREIRLAVSIAWEADFTLPRFKIFTFGRFFGGFFLASVRSYLA